MDTEVGPHDEFLAEKADAIRRLARNVARDVTEIGRHLTEAKARCGHGNWLAWLQREFQWSERTARNYIGIHELAKTANFADLEPLDISSLYLLAAPSTPECARETVATRIQAGETPTYSEVWHIVQVAKLAPLYSPPVVAAFGESRPFAQAARTLDQMGSPVAATTGDLIAAGRASAAVQALLRFGEIEIDADAVRTYLARCGRTHEFFEAISKAVSLRRELEPRPPRPDYLKPVE